MLRSERRAGLMAVSALLCGVTLSARSADAQDAIGRIDALQQLNGSVESLVQRVAQSVVQVIVTSYGPMEKGNGAETDLTVGRQRTVGSGIAVESDGYIVTNAHVIRHSRRIEIVLPGRGRTVAAKIIASGGPLVNVNGELVGINTFILSDSGGSQRLGFAIPSALVQMAYPKLRGRSLVG